MKRSEGRRRFHRFSTKPARQQETKNYRQEGEKQVKMLKKEGFKETPWLKSSPEIRRVSEKWKKTQAGGIKSKMKVT